MTDTPIQKCLVRIQYTEDGNPVYTDYVATCFLENGAWKISIPVADFPFLSRQGFVNEMRMSVPDGEMKAADNPGWQFEIERTLPFDAT